MKSKNEMTFDEALKILDIEDYKDRIFNSNSHGELFHLQDYIIVARLVQKEGVTTKFRKWFERLIKWAEDNWERPESVFQHIIKCLYDEEE